MPPRGARKRKALQELELRDSNGLGTSQEDSSQAEYLDAIQDMIDNIDKAVEEKIHEINQATKNAVASLNTALKTRLVRLPKALKMMPLDQLSGKVNTQKPVPVNGSTQETTKDANAGRETIPTRSIRSTRSKKDAAETVATDLPAVDNGESKAPRSAVGPEGASKAVSKAAPPPRFEDADNGSPPPIQFSRAKKRAAIHAEEDPADQQPATSYNGLPLQTPLPFAGKAVPLPVQMLTVQAQGKRAGGKTKASRNAPQAAVVTTKDGKQWAVGANGLRDIPESHRKEVSEYLQSQFAFLQDALRL